MSSNTSQTKLLAHIAQYRKHTGASKDEIIAKLVETIFEEGTGDTILGTFEIPAGPPRPKVRKPAGFIGSHKTGSLDPSITVDEINKALGDGKKFKVEGDPYKVKHQWDFTVDGVECSIWDYKGVRWSTYGPASAFEKLGLKSYPERY